MVGSQPSCSQPVAAGSCPGAVGVVWQRRRPGAMLAAHGWNGSRPMEGRSVQGCSAPQQGPTGCGACRARSARWDRRADACDRCFGPGARGRLQPQPGRAQGGGTGDLHVDVGPREAHRARDLGFQQRWSGRRVRTLGDAYVPLAGHIQGGSAGDRRQGAGQTEVQARDGASRAAAASAAAAAATTDVSTFTDTATTPCAGAAAAGDWFVRAHRDRAIPGRADRGQLHDARCPAAALLGDGARRRAGHGAMPGARLSVSPEGTVRGARVRHATSRRGPICAHPGLRRALAQAWRSPPGLRRARGSDRQVHELQDPSPPSAATSGPLPCPGWGICHLMWMSL
jgi:hypothetical protein